MPARSDLSAPYPLKGSTKRSPRSPDCSLLRSLSSFLTHFYCKDKMIWYAVGITTVIFYFIVRAQLRRMPIDMDCTSDSDSGGEWDASPADSLSETLKDRFARF